MSDGTQQRHARRYPIQLPLFHRPAASMANKTRIGWTRDLSETGACVELDRSVSAPTQLQVRFQTDREAIDAEAEVVWVKEPVGSNGGTLHGLSFTNLARHQRQALLRVLLAWGLTRRGGVRVPIEVAVTCQIKGKMGPPLHGQARNGSRDGLLLRLPQVVPPGTTLEVSLRRQNGPLAAEGVVIWVAPPEGRTHGDLIQHGLRLTSLEWSMALALAGDLLRPLEDTPWFAHREGNV
jgi:c-di-GMP-binding flagellar brake protein YcgR